VLAVNGCENGLAHPRLGLSVSRKWATQSRNAWSCRIAKRSARREVLPAGIDFVVRPQKEAVLDFHAIANPARTCHEDCPQPGEEPSMNFLRFIVRLPGLFSSALSASTSGLQPIIGRQCRFQPTCSHYFIGAVEKYAIRGSLKGIWGICRCKLFCRGGDDPP
jgi:putative membrane protein insertion efficiency factor